MEYRLCGRCTVREELTKGYHEKRFLTFFSTSHWRRRNPTLAKAEGMFRFYLEGKRPLNQQAWPEILGKSQSEKETDA